jgi:hypothetical protein
MAKIKSINVLSLGKILAVVNAVLGLIQGLLVTVGSMTGVDMSQGYGPAICHCLFSGVICRRRIYRRYFDGGYL